MNTSQSRIEQCRQIGDRILVRPELMDERTASGLIIIPDTARKEVASVGRVLRVGPGKWQADGTRAQMPVKEGDRIVYNAMAGEQVQLSGEMLKVMDSEDVFGVVED